jgi:hypothetical protein
VSAEDNKAVIRRLIEEVYNQGNLDVVDELVAADVFNHPAVPGLRIRRNSDLTPSHCFAGRNLVQSRSV